MQISSPSNFINYFKDCYKLDNKEFTVRNLLSNKYKYKWFSKGDEELLNGASPIIFYDNSDVENLEKELVLYALEKSLYYASFLVIGKESPVGWSTDSTVCSPLILYPCSIERKDGDHFLRLDRNDLLLNHSLINSILKHEEDKTALRSGLNDFFSKPILDVFDLIKLLNRYTVVDTTELSLYPKNWNIQQIKKAISSSSIDEPLKMIPASGTLFIQKSISPIKVITDLEKIADHNAFNTALQNLFDNNQSNYPVNKSILDSKLNAAQIQAMRNSEKYINSVIIGPPGTGKSYTITAMAVDMLLKNKSVLIVSKTKQAVEVIRENLAKDYNLQDTVIDTVGRSFNTSLKAKIRRKLNGFTKRVSYTQTDISAIHNKVEGNTRKFEELVKKELRLANLTFKEDINFTEWFEKYFAKLFASKNDALMDTVEDLHNSLKQINDSLNSYVPEVALKNSNHYANEYRKDLNTFYNALNAESFSSSQSIIDLVDFDKLLKVYPIWLAHLSELNTILPQQADLFDLVIIDEATQCDIATALPAIYRAKHVVVCGDPNQLRHYSFVATSQQDILREKYRLPQNPTLDYRNRSILDLYINNMHSQDQVTFLREHYRSTPSLIAFNNQEFYNNQLEIIKSTSNFTATNQIELHFVKGSRNAKGINEIESKKVIDKIGEIIKQSIDLNLKPSIGVITPFADQAKFINKEIREKFSISSIKSHDLLCGTPYQFQGSERDIILISFCVCDNTHHSAFRHLNQREVLNVGTTRAKSKQYVYTSVDPNHLNPESLFAKYLSCIANYNYHNKVNSDKQDAFQTEVANFLNGKAIDEVHLGYPFAGQNLDVFIQHRNKYYCLDLIGYPGDYMESLSLERYKTFARIGIKTIPLHYRFWKDDNKKAKQKLQELIT